MAILVAVCVLPAIVLWPARNAGPVADDFFFIATAGEEPIAQSFTSGWRHPMGRSTGLRPMAVLSYAIDHSLHAKNAAAWRLTNFGLHGTASVLLALVVAAVTGSRLAGAVAAALFAVHPAHHENVMWISGRPYVLGTAFGLAALLACVQAHIPRRRPRAAALSTVAAASALAALLSYEAMIVIAPVASLIVIAVPEMDWRRAIRITWPLWLATLVYLAWRVAVVSAPVDDLAYLVQADSLSASVSNTRNMALRVFACGGCVRFREPSTSASFMVSIAITLLASVLNARSNARALAALAMATLVAFTPFVTADAFTDRFVYLTTAPPAALIGSGMARLAHGWRRTLVALALVGTLSVSWARQLVLLSNDWVSAGTLAATVVERLHELAPELSERHAVHAFDLPGLLGEAPVFPTYFFLAVQQRYGNDRLVIHERGSSADARRVADAMAKRAPQDYVIRWDFAAGGWQTLALPRSGP